MREISNSQHEQTWFEPKQGALLTCEVLQMLKNMFDVSFFEIEPGGGQPDVYGHQLKRQLKDFFRKLVLDF